MNIEIDENKLFDEVARRCHDSLIHLVREEVVKLIKLELAQAVRVEARKHIESIMGTTTLPDGRPFKQYVEGLFNNAVTKNYYGERPRIGQIVETILNDQATRIYAELVRPHADEFRKKLQQRVAANLFDGVGVDHGG